MAIGQANIEPAIDERSIHNRVGWREAENDTERLNFVIMMLEMESQKRFEAETALLQAKGQVTSLQYQLESANQIVDTVTNLHSLIAGRLGE